MCFVGTEGGEIITTGLKKSPQRIFTDNKIICRNKGKNNTNHGRNNNELA